MDEPDKPVQGEYSSYMRDSDLSRTDLITQPRRRFLQAITGGCASMLAGCGQDVITDESASTVTGTKRENPSSGGPSQPFRAPVKQNPAKVSFYAIWTGNQALESTFAVTPKEKASGRLVSIIREPGVWANHRFVGGDTYYTWLEDITITPTEATVKIRDDATWSDRHPITGKDIAVRVMSSYLRNQFPPFFMTEKEGEPTLPVKAIDGFEIQDKSVIYRSSAGYFDAFWDLTFIGFLGGGQKVVPTHIDPYGTYANAVFETARRAIQGEINPWKGWDDPVIRPDDPHTASLIEKHLAKEGKYVEKFSDPESVVSNSAWDLVELDGSQAVFEPNPHHRNADQINFDQFTLEYTPSEKRALPALMADRLDYAAPGPTPQTVVEELPETISQLQIPGGQGTGNELHLDFNHPALGNRKVRQAIMYALDQLTIANNIHRSAALPVTNPGGDCWDATDYVSKDWIDANLTTYGQNQDKAASLMRGAGFTKDGGKWIHADGEPLTLSLPTKSSTPRWEPTVASQLTEFGIQTTVQTLREGVFESRESNGQFDMWAESGILTSTADRTLAYWYSVAVHPKVYGVYPREQYKTGTFSTRGHPVPRTQDRYDVFSIEAPPIGQPTGPLQKYHPSALAIAFFSQPSESEFRRRVKTAMWLANWLLPVIPINKTIEQHFIDVANWKWPNDTPAWQTFTNSGPKSIGSIFASGTVQANPDNPEQA